MKPSIYSAPRSSFRYIYRVGGEEYARGTLEEIMTQPEYTAEEMAAILNLGLGETWTDGGESYERIG